MIVGMGGYLGLPTFVPLAFWARRHLRNATEQEARRLALRLSLILLPVCALYVVVLSMITKKVGWPDRFYGAVAFGGIVAPFVLRFGYGYVALAFAARNGRRNRCERATGCHQPCLVQRDRIARPRNANALPQSGLLMKP